MVVDNPSPRVAAIAGGNTALRANDGETSTPREFRLEGAEGSSRPCPWFTRQSTPRAGAATNGGRRPTVVAAPVAASPELSDRPRRRTFTAQDKLRILAETDRAADDRWHRRHSAPRGPLLLDPDRLAPAARRRSLRRAGPGQARPQDRRTQPAGSRTRPRCNGTMPVSRGAWHAPRPSSTSKKKLRSCWASRWRRSDDEP